MIAQGKTKQQILDVFVAEYGGRTCWPSRRAAAEAVAVWLVPRAVILSGIVAALAIVLLLPRWKRRRSDDTDAPAEQLSFKF